MKSTLLLLITFMTFSLKAQYTLETHPLYSDVWVIEKEDGYNMLLPKYGKTQFNIDHIKNSVDLDKVKEYLLESYNEFRSDYGVGPVVEDIKMTKESSSYAKTLIGKQLVHQKGPFGECLTTIPYMTLSHLNPDTIDINKVIADCYFDKFVGSPGHMAVLLNPNKSVAGFGIAQSNSGFVVCLRNH